VVRALAEAWGWLHAKGLIARTPGRTSCDAIFVTPHGLGVGRDGLAPRASERLDVDLHPSLVPKV